MTTIAISTTTGEDGEYARAVEAARAVPRLLRFDLKHLDAQLAGAGGVLLTGGGDVDPQLYGPASDLAAHVNMDRDVFEIALVKRARDLRIPTLCICRGLQVANVAFGGTLVADIGSALGSHTAALHRLQIDGQSVRGIIAGHEVEVEPGSRLAAIVGDSPIATGSRHHQSVAAIAADLRVVGTTRDGIVEAAEALFPSPFWLGVQWHPEETLRADNGASRSIFDAFVEAAARFGVS